MILAKNSIYSLHRLKPDTYSHETYVLTEKLGSNDYRVTLFSAPKAEQKKRLKKLVRSIENGANGSNIELYPLHFICDGFPDIGVCPANERATALKELKLAES